MTPLTPNPTGPKSGPKSFQQGQNQSFDVSPVTQDHPPLFNFFDQFPENHDPKDHKLALHYGGSSSSSTNPRQIYNPSSDSAMVDQSIVLDTKLSSSMEVKDSGKIKDPRVEKWNSSKIRLMKSLMIPERSYGEKNENKEIINNATAGAASNPSDGGDQNEGYNQGSPTSRVCVECLTTSTPLWRSGPRGPKSLCNACGIRQRKERQAAAEAAISLVTSTKTKGLLNKEKEKKLLVNKCTQFKKNNTTSTSTVAAAATTTITGSSSSEDMDMERRLKTFLSSVKKKSGFEDTTEEVCDIALLLMDISCGYVYP